MRLVIQGVQSPDDMRRLSNESQPTMGGNMAAIEAQFRVQCPKCRVQTVLATAEIMHGPVQCANCSNVFAISTRALIECLDGVSKVFRHFSRTA